MEFKPKKDFAPSAQNLYVIPGQAILNLRQILSNLPINQIGVYEAAMELISVCEQVPDQAPAEEATEATVEA
jgi:hypothetical protein